MFRCTNLKRPALEWTLYNLLLTHSRETLQTSDKDVQTSILLTREIWLHPRCKPPGLTSTDYPRRVMDIQLEPWTNHYPSTHAAVSQHTAWPLGLIHYKDHDTLATEIPQRRMFQGWWNVQLSYPKREVPTAKAIRLLRGSVKTRFRCNT